MNFIMKIGTLTVQVDISQPLTLTHSNSSQTESVHQICLRRYLIGKLEHITNKLFHFESEVQFVK